MMLLCHLFVLVLSGLISGRVVKCTIESDHVPEYRKVMNTEMVLQQKEQELSECQADAHMREEQLYSDIGELKDTVEKLNAQISMLERSLQQRGEHNRICTEQLHRSNMEIEHRDARIAKLQSVIQSLQQHTEL